MFLNKRVLQNVKGKKCNQVFFELKQQHIYLWCLGGGGKLAQHTREKGEWWVNVPFSMLSTLFYHAINGGGWVVFIWCEHNKSPEARGMRPFQHTPNSTVD